MGRISKLTISKQQTELELRQITGIIGVHAVLAAALKRFALPGTYLVMGLGIGCALGYCAAPWVYEAKVLHSPLQAGISIGKQKTVLLIAALASLVIPMLGFVVGIGYGFLTGLSLEYRQYRAMGGANTFDL